MQLRARSPPCSTIRCDTEWTTQTPEPHTTRKDTAPAFWPTFNDVRSLSATCCRRLRCQGSFSGNWPATLAAIAAERGLDGGDIEVWFGDQARIGQKTKITRRWARRGTRPSAPSDQRTASTYI